MMQWDNPWKLLIVVFVVLLLFGGKKIPELARSLGQSLNEFQKGKGESDPKDRGKSAGGSDSKQF